MRNWICLWANLFHGIFPRTSGDVIKGYLLTTLLHLLAAYAKSQSPEMWQILHDITAYLVLAKSATSGMRVTPLLSCSASSSHTSVLLHSSLCIYLDRTPTVAPFIEPRCLYFFPFVPAVHILSTTQLIYTTVFESSSVLRQVS